LTTILRLKRSRVTFRALEPACEILLAGGVVSAPTESFYGLMALADRERALERLHALKGGRGKDHAFLLLVDCYDRVKAYAQEIPPEAERLMETFWPGLLTILFKAQSGLHPAILGGKKNTVGLRLDSAPVSPALVRMADRAVTGTSANPSGRPPATDAATVIGYFGDGVDYVIDCGSTRGGLPSTVVDISKTPFSIQREGAVLSADLDKVLSPARVLRPSDAS
jgi:L-threonylcarbamoyladenylate synthase